MKITYLKLENYKRLPLRENSVLEYSFTEKLTMLSGPNGCGKSSVFNELTPLPSDRKDFYKNGYKEIHIEYRGKQYVLISDFRKGNAFSFNVDGEELNRAGLVTAQRQFVEQHFNITPITHELFVGKQTFTNMSLVNRKKLFSAITHLNIDGVINFYLGKREDLKDQNNLLKSQYALLKSEENKLLDTDRQTELEKIIENTKSHIEHLYSFRTELSKYQTSKDPETIATKIHELRSNYTAIMKEQWYGLTSTPLSELDSIKERYESQISDTIDVRLNTLYDELEQLRLTREKYIDIEGTNHGTLLKERKSMEDHITRLRSELRYIKNTERVQEQHQALLMLTSELPEICSNLPFNEIDGAGNLKYSHANGLRVSEELRTLTKAMHLTESSIISMEDKIKHLRTHKDNVVCPKCEYEWSPSNREQQLEECDKELQRLYGEQRTQKEASDRLSKELEEQREVYELYRRFDKLRESSKDLFPGIWSQIDEENLITQSPSEVPYVFESLENDIRTLGYVEEIEHKLEMVNFRIKIMEDSKERSLSEVRSRYESTEKAIQELQIEKQSLQSKLSYIGTLQTTKHNLSTINDRLNIERKALRESFMSKVVTDLIDEIQTEIAVQKGYLVETETQLREQQNIRYIIDQYNKTIESINQEIKILSIITEELSPKNGLIARSVSSFLNMIILNVNNTIRSIWGYKMELLPIDVNTDPLNYKFKVNVEDRLHIDDISTVSKGMGEIINLSFKLVLYKLLGIDLPPLFLDELGSHLDKHHTDKIVWLINQLTMSDEYSQIFLVSHKENFNFIRDVDVVDLA